MDNSEQSSIAITLSPAQVDEVVRAASQSRVPSISTLIAASLNRPLTREAGTDSPSAPSDAAELAHPTDRADGATETPADTVDEDSQIGGYLPKGASDPRLSRSLLRGLSLLTCFGADGAARGVVELAHDAGMSPSTAHRYASTLVELGLLERDPRSRKYRLPSV
ncbi:MAG: helix-turn-helix domain-containing protein [Solirubrobacteraceae bacterium]